MRFSQGKVEPILQGPSPAHEPQPGKGDLDKVRQQPGKINKIYFRTPFSILSCQLVSAIKLPECQEAIHLCQLQ